MIEQALRRFCESRHRTLIVIAGTFVVGLVLVMPLVDVIRAGHDEKEALLAELDSARQCRRRALRDVESQRHGKACPAEVLEARTVDDESLPALRGKLVDLAKETGCSIRRLSVGAASSRPWKPGENPIAPTASPKPGRGRFGISRWNGGR